ncbi:penicillin-binding protein 1C [compost metagenome]
MQLYVSALGGGGQRWWFRNGQPLGETSGQDSLLVRFEQVGRVELSVLDESGETARVEFQVDAGG